jgi:uncharacterized protein (DUF924 family)
MATAEELKPVLRDIHRYWIGDLKAHDEIPKEKLGIWFRQSAETDQQIRQRFGRYIAEAAAIDWDLASLSREEQVGLVVLLDQFPRNLYRTSAESFAYDAKAREVASALIDAGKDRFPLIEQLVLFVPFEHSENIADQDRGVMLVAGLAVTSPESFRDSARDFLDYFTRHRDLIRKFGRFPHRNAILGRESTPEETAFLAEQGRGY